MAYKLVTDGLVACWDASNWTSGTTWTDNIAGKNITFSSAPSSKSDDGIELTTSITFSSASLSSLSLSNACTFEWLGRIDGTFSSSAPGNVFGLSSSNGSWAGICCYAKTSSNGVQFDIGSSGTITSGVYTAGIEYHIIATVSGTTTTMYCNSTTAKGTTTNSNGYGSKTYLYNSEGSGRFYGAIQRMALWNKCLSASEIAELFEEDVPLVTYTVTASATGGTISPSGEISVSSGGSQEFKLFPDDGYEFKSMTVNGASVVPSLVTPPGTASWSVSTNYGTYSSYSLSNINDGSTSTYWWSNEAQSSGKYVLVTFDAEVTLNSFSTYSSNSSDYPKSTNVLQVSSDGSEWETIGNFQNSQTSTFSSIGKLCKYVRIYAQSTTSNWLVINEITMDYSVEADSYLSYTLTDIQEDMYVVVVFSSGDGAFVRVASGWVKSLAIYKKVSGVWYECDISEAKTIVDSADSVAYRTV